MSEQRKAGIKKWFDETIGLVESASPKDRDQSVVTAVGMWVGYPQIIEAIECHPELDEDECHSLRLDLDRVHALAVDLLMMEAEKADLNSAALAEERRICHEIFRQVRSNSPSNSYGIDWLHHPHCAYFNWPDCLGEWRYSLPTAMQEAIRQGEAVFIRLMTKLSITPAPPIDIERAADRPDVTTAPATMSASRIAEQLGLTEDAAESRLRRARRDNMNCFMEVKNRLPTEPKYLYYSAIVLPMIQKN